MSNPIVRFAVTVEYTYQCTHCGAQERNGMAISRGNELMLPVLPDGWRAVDEYVFCPKHQVDLKVLTDGAEIHLYGVRGR